MNNVIEKRYHLVLTSLSIALFVSFFVSLCIGRFHTSLSDVFLTMIGKNVDAVSHNVIVNLRIPRAISSILIGCALATSGTIYQSVFNNKLVSPDILGVSSGSSVGACFAILLGLSSVYISTFSFLMGFLTVFLSAGIAFLFKNRTNILLILSGLAVGGLMSSIIGLLKYLADSDMKLSEMTFWLLGDLSGSNYKNLIVLVPVVVIGVVASLILSNKLNLISLGKKEMQSLGDNYSFHLVIQIIIATSLTAVSVAISGTIGWIGLVIPNIVRIMVGSNNRKVLPLSMVLGGLFLLISDVLARSIAPNEIPLSIITGILGTPLFVFVLFFRRKEIR